MNAVFGEGEYETEIELEFHEYYTFIYAIRNVRYALIIIKCRVHFYLNLSILFL